MELIHVRPSIISRRKGGRLFLDCGDVAVYEHNVAAFLED
jgi:hypothetical protein